MRIWEGGYRIPMTLAAVTFLGRDWLWLAVLLMALATFFLFFGYRSAPLGRRGSGAAFFLKWFGLLLLAFGLLDPHRVRFMAKPGANYFAVVVDTSGSLRVKDRDSVKERGELLREALVPERALWMGVLERDFQVRQYALDSQLLEVGGLGDRPFDGKSSMMITGLKELGDRFRGRPLAGVLFFTDGNATDAGLGLGGLAGMPPIYPVMVGSDKPPLDLAVRTVSARESEFEDAPVTIQAEVSGAGYGGREVTAQLMEISREQSGVAKPVMELTQTMGALEGPLVFRFQFRPARSGLGFYRVKAVVKHSGSGSGSEGRMEEATLVNNERMVVVRRPSDQYRVLYVSGRPNWEYKFLRRALKEDDQVKMTGLIRIAKREPKFEFRGRAGERSNPLFRGFGGVENETQRYDQPVMVRMDTKDQTELSGGFPKLAEELFQYHAVILDDLEAEFFTQEQMNLLLRFVSERGGGVLMLGGQESFREGNYGRSVLASLLPVYLDDNLREEGTAAVGGVEPDYKWGLSREGWLQPWVRLRDLETAERERLESMPTFRVFNRVGGLKPGASLMVGVRSGGREWPALAVQNYGHGRSAALMVGDLWRWGMRDEASQKDLAKAWRQLTRWLVADTLKPVELVVASKGGDRGEARELSVRVRKADYDPMDEAQVAVDVKPLGSKPHEGSGGRISIEAAGDDPGAFRGEYWSGASGAYVAQAVVADGGGKPYGEAEAGWVSEPDADEFASVQANLPWARELAKATRGQVLRMDELKDFVPTLASRAVPIQETVNEPLWHRSIWLVLAVLCFATEWGLRRRGGLA